MKFLDKKVQDDADSYDDGTYDQVYTTNALPLRSLNKESSAKSSASNVDTITRINNPYYDEGSYASSTLDNGTHYEVLDYFFQ